MRLALVFERAMQALRESREREAARVIRRHAHFFAQAQAYERDRVIAQANAPADAETTADATSMMAQAGLLAPRASP